MQLKINMLYMVSECSVSDSSLGHCACYKCDKYFQQHFHINCCALPSVTGCKLISVDSRI